MAARTWGSRRGLNEHAGRLRSSNKNGGGDIADLQAPSRAAVACLPPAAEHALLLERPAPPLEGSILTLPKAYGYSVSALGLLLLNAEVGVSCLLSAASVVLFHTASLADEPSRFVNPSKRLHTTGSSII